MTPEEEFNQAIWWILQEIKKEYLSTPKGGNVYFGYQASNNLIPSKEDQRRALRLLENDATIKIAGYKYPKPFDLSYVAEGFNIEPMGCFLKIFQPKFNEIYNEFSKNSREEIQNQQKTSIGKENDLLVFYTKDNVELKFNKENGDFIFGRVDGNFALETNEYKVFLCLLENPSHQAEYKTLLKLMYPDKEFREQLKKYQVERWGLDSIIRNIKNGLGILPKKKSKNKDIFRSLRKWKGYRLI